MVRLFSLHVTLIRIVDRKKIDGLVPICTEFSCFFKEKIKTFFTLFFSEDYFKCQNGVNISLRKRCDGQYDCKFVGKRPDHLDLSDEKHCPRCKFHLMNQLTGTNH